MWLNKFILDLKAIENISKSLELYFDNELTVCYSYNKKSSAAIKQVDIKHYDINKKVHDQTDKLEHIHREQMLATPLTEDLDFHPTCSEITYWV
jgi:phosphoglycerate-specific signal transduction histidine kinase